MNICKECANYEYKCVDTWAHPMKKPSGKHVYHRCYRLAIPVVVITDPVTGATRENWREEFLDCNKERYDPNGCAIEGKYFLPKHVPILCLEECIKKEPEMEYVVIGE